jgi:copper(I)-binding protein
VAGLHTRRFGAALTLLAARLAHADCGALRIEQPHILAGPPGTPVLAGYAVLRNPGDSPVTVTGFDSGAFATVELHRMSSDHGTLQMRPEAQLTVPAHGQLDIRPGERHLMLSDPKAPLNPGDHVTLRFRCGDAATSADFPVQAP